MENIDRPTEPTPYDLREVIVADNTLSARPVEWDAEPIDNEGHDKDGRVMVATKYQTACPKCGCLIEFEAKYSEVACDNCQAGHMVLLPLYDAFEEPFQDPGIVGVDFAAVPEPIGDI
jgi:hypothetical protein